MKIIMITNDPVLTKMGTSSQNISGEQLTIYNSDPNPLNVVSFVYENNPSSLIIDDDYLKPNSAQIIETIRKVHKNLAIVFTTSDHSLKLGKEVSQLGIHYYAIKPFDTKEFDDLINSISKAKTKLTY